jgi:hypothetical protein
MKAIVQPISRQIVSSLYHLVSAALCIFMMLFFVSVRLTQAEVQQPDQGADLAQELTNPIADLMTIPIQINYDQDIGANDDGKKIQTNIQPVVPFSLNESWGMFFSLKKPTAGGVIWGVGPIFLLPTATNSLLGARKWDTGPTAVALTMRGPWTVGLLANHV